MIKEDLAGFAGKVIKDIRLAKEITLMELAEKVHISYQQLQKYENGQNRVSVDRLYSIARYLQTDVAAFFPSYVTETTKTDPYILKASHALAEIKDVQLKGILMKLIGKLAG